MESERVVDLDTEEDKEGNAEIEEVVDPEDEATPEADEECDPEYELELDDF